MKICYVVFDYECGFCNKVLMFFARNDINREFIFVSSGSKLGQDMLKSNNLDGIERQSILLFESKTKIFVESEAVRRILLKIPYYRILAYFFILFPISFKNKIYRYVSLNRKRLLKNNTCVLPNKEIINYFILK